MKIEEFQITKIYGQERYGIYSYGETDGVRFQSHILEKNLKTGDRITLLSQIPAKDLANSLREAIGRVKSYAKANGVKVKKVKASKIGASFKIITNEELKKN